MLSFLKKHGVSKEEVLATKRKRDGRLQFSVPHPKRAGSVYGAGCSMAVHHMHWQVTVRPPGPRDSGIVAAVCTVVVRSAEGPPAYSGFLA